MPQLAFVKYRLTESRHTVLTWGYIKYTILEMSRHLFNTPVDRKTKLPIICHKPDGFIVIPPRKLGIMVDILYLPGLYM
jgi:hypothetical protein